MDSCQSQDDNNYSSDDEIENVIISDENIDTENSISNLNEDEKLMKEFKEDCNKLEVFLQKFECQKGSPSNITRFQYPTGVYYIPLNKYEDFLTLYYNIWSNPIYQKDPTLYILNFCERNCEIKPLLFDVDIDFVENYEGNDRPYTIILEDVINDINTVIRENFEVKDITLYLLEKKYPTDRNNDYKDGVHIQVNIPFSPNQRDYIYDQLVKKANEKKLFDKLLVKPTNNDIYDKSTINVNPWLMYGSTKTYLSTEKLANPEYILNKYGKKIYFSPKYELTKTYLNGEEIENPDKYDLLDILTIRQFEIKNIPVIKVKKGKEFINDFTFDNKNNSNNTSNNIKRKEFKNNNNNDNNIYYDVSISEMNRINEAIAYLNMLGPKRWDEYPSWRNALWSCKSVSSNLFNSVMEFSKKSKKFKYEVFMDTWNRGKIGYGMCNMNTLRLMAMEDNYEAYTNYINNNTKLITNALKNNLEDIALFIVPRLSNYIVSGCDKNANWYVYEMHRWCLENNLTKVFDIIHQCGELVYKEGENKINSIIKNKEKRLNEYNNINCDSETEEKRNATQKRLITKKYDAEIKKTLVPYENLSRRLMNVQTKNNDIIAACANHLIYQDKNKGMRVNENGELITIDTSIFENVLDSNDTIIGFTNGVFDMKTWSFRSGLPTDYISMSTGYDYKDYTGDEPIFTELKNYFNSLFHNDEYSKFVLYNIANCLFEGNTEQRFYICVGGGSNGKSSLFCNLMKSVFGSYYTPIDPSLFTQNKKSNSVASPETLALKNKRMAVMSETNKDEKLNSAKVKQATGKTDELIARQLYSNQINTFVNLSTPFMLTNKMPLIDTDDDGMWKRIIVLPFKSRFLKPEKMPSDECIKQNEKIGVYFSQIDETLDKRIKKVEFIQATMWYLLNILKNNKNVPIPKNVQDETDKYRKDNNYNAKFIEEYCDKTPDGKCSYNKLTSLYQKFMKLYNITPNNKDLDNYLSTNGYEIKLIKEGGIRGNYVFGLKISEEENENSEFSFLENSPN